MGRHVKYSYPPLCFIMCFQKKSGAAEEVNDGLYKFLGHSLSGQEAWEVAFVVMHRPAGGSVFHRTSIIIIIK